MKILSLIFNILLIVNPKELSKDGFYTVLSGNSLKAVTEMIVQLESKEKNARERAYLATLYMKKADFLKDLKLKISSFKKGASLLELEIENNDCFENRFLRFIIQENAPKILKYNQNLEEDKLYLLKNINLQSKSLKKHFLDYAKDSKLLIFTE